MPVYTIFVRRGGLLVATVKGGDSPAALAARIAGIQPNFPASDDYQISIQGRRTDEFFDVPVGIAMDTNCARRARDAFDAWNTLDRAEEWPLWDAMVAAQRANVAHDDVLTGRMDEARTQRNLACLKKAARVPIGDLEILLLACRAGHVNDTHDTRIAVFELQRALDNC